LVRETKFGKSAELDGTTKFGKSAELDATTKFGKNAELYRLDKKMPEIDGGESSAKVPNLVVAASSAKVPNLTRPLEQTLLNHYKVNVRVRPCFTGFIFVFLVGFSCLLFFLVPVVSILVLGSFFVSMASFFHVLRFHCFIFSMFFVSIASFFVFGLLLVGKSVLMNRRRVNTSSSSHPILWVSKVLL